MDGVVSGLGLGVGAGAGVGVGVGVGVGAGVGVGVGLANPNPNPTQASIEGVGVNSQELLSALRLIAANPSVASALPPLERTTADRPSRPSRAAP